MKSKHLNNARSGKTPSKNSAPSSRRIDLSREYSPGLNFDQVITSIGRKIVYTDLRTKLITVTALRPLVTAGFHSMANVFEGGERMHLLMMHLQHGISAFAVFNDAHPLSLCYACRTTEHAEQAWEFVLQEQKLRQDFLYPMDYSQEALEFCRMTPPLIAPSGPFLTHHILPGHFEYPHLFRDLLAFEAHLFCVLSLSKDSHALDRN